MPSTGDLTDRNVKPHTKVTMFLAMVVLPILFAMVVLSGRESAFAVETDQGSAALSTPEEQPLMFRAGVKGFLRGEGAGNYENSLNEKRLAHDIAGFPPEWVFFRDKGVVNGLV